MTSLVHPLAAWRLVSARPAVSLAARVVLQWPHAAGAYQQARHKASTAAALAPDASQDLPGQLDTEPLPFDAVPGPKGLPVIGTLLEVLRNLGKGHELVTRRFREYGPIFKEKAGPMTFVNLADLEAIEHMLRLEGLHPRRITIPAWNQWREDSKLAKGILIEDGPDWKRMRKILDKRMLRPIHVATYTEKFNEVTTDFLAHLRNIRDTKGGGVTIPKVDMELFHWSLETIGTVLYETRFGGFDENRNPEIQKFISAVHGVFKSTEKAIYLPPSLTSHYKLHTESWQAVFDGTSRLIDRKMREINDQLSRGQEVTGFLSHLLASEVLSREELNANISELMLGAVDTTSNTMQWVLYQLSRNKDVQDRLHREVMDATSEGKCIPDNTTLKNMPYLKAIIKEVLRMYPVAGVVARILPHDMVLCGYNIPSGTTVLASTYYTGRDPDSFPEPDTFMPERWLRAENAHKHTFAWLPFGFGPRMCIGRRVAELEMQLLIARLSQEFFVEPLNDVPLMPATRGLLVPERSVEIKLIDRK